MRDRLLLHAVRVPLCSAEELAALAHAHPASVRRALRALAREGLLIGEVVRPVDPRERRYRPSRRGLALAAGLQGCRAADLARDHGHAARALVALRNRIERVAAARAAILALLPAVGTGESPATTVQWAAPARVLQVPVDGLVRVADGRTGLDLVLLLDNARLAPHQLLPRLAALGRALDLRSRPSHVLLVAAHERRARLLRALADEEARRGRAPQAGVWTPPQIEAQGAAALLGGRGGPPPRWGEDVAPSAPAVSFGPWAGTTTEERIAQARQRLSPAAMALLDWLADHPLQGAADTAVAFGVSAVAARRLLRRLAACGLVAGVPGWPPRYGLIRLGLELVAVRDGWRPEPYARARGVRLADLAGRGGLDGVRRHVDHTVEADGFFLGPLAYAARRQRAGLDEALVVWEGPAACHRRFRVGGAWRNLRPDGFGVYRSDGMAHPFHLEWDRGTLRLTQHEAKLRVYRAYVEAGAYVPDRGRLPTLLYVFPDPVREARVRRLIGTAFAGLPQVPVLTTNRGLLDAYGAAGAIWRSPLEEGRRHWLPQLPEGNASP